MAKFLKCNLFFVFIFILVFSQAIQAKTQRALVVGVSNYYHLAPRFQLEGPVNDSVLVNKMLLDRGFKPKNIRQLVSSKDKNDDTEPTHSNIISALSYLAESSEAGDFVYLHFGGHGSRQPASSISNDEPDGLDEIFLPADTKKWDSFIGSVVNAITDDEIASYIDQIRNKGSDVWVVWDSCHSGGMSRGLGQSGVRYRKVSGSDLGITKLKASSGVKTKTHSRGKNAPLKENNFLQNPSVESSHNKIDSKVKKGALISFSASQSEQTTPEMELPFGNEASQYHGLFTYTLMEVLAKNRGISYQQLAQQVNSLYMSLPEHMTIPLFSASDISASVFNESDKSVNQWKAIRNQDLLTIPAGRLNLLSEGAIVGIYDGATAESIIAKATIIKSQAMQSEAKIDSKATDVSELPEDVYVRLLSPHIDFQMAVYVVRTQGQSEKDINELSEVISEIAGKNTLLIRSESNARKADLFVAKFDNKLWFIKPDQKLPCDIQYGLGDKERKLCEQDHRPERLSFLKIIKTIPLKVLAKQGLLRIAKVNNLLAVQSALGTMRSSLKLDFFVESKSSGKSKSSAEPGAKVEDIVDIDVAPSARTGDWINLSIKNQDTKAQSITVLFIDSQYGIYLVYPRGGEANVLKPGEGLKERLKVNVDTTGFEHMIVLNAPFTGVVQSFGFLKQPPLSVSTPKFSVSTKGSRGRGSDLITPLQRMMNAAKTGMPLSRGLVLENEQQAPQSGFRMFSWETLR